MRESQTLTAMAARAVREKSAAPDAGEPAATAPSSPASEPGGPRELIEQAARDIRRGLLDTDLHGVPSNVPGPHRAPQRSEGAVIPAEGVDRTTYSRRQRRKSSSGG